MRSLFLLVLIWADLSWNVVAFSIQNHSTRRTSPMPSIFMKQDPRRRRSTSVVGMASDNDSKNSDGNDYGETHENDAVDSEKGKKDTVGKKVFRGVYSVYSYTATFFGILLSLGLVLNILGYGYIWQDGSLRVDTIQQLREERQFERISRGIEDPFRESATWIKPQTIEQMKP